MRILLLHSSSDTYGASKIFLQTVLLLQREGHIPIVVLSNEGNLSHALISRGVDVHIVNLAILRRKYFNFSGLMNRYKRWRVAVQQLAYIIETHQIDKVYSNTLAVLVGAYVAKKTNRKHIWHVHEIIEKPFWMHRFFAWCLRKGSDKIIVVSKAVEQHWKDALSTNAFKPQMLQIYNGIEALNTHTPNSIRQQLAIPDNAILIGMAARIHYWKGQNYFVEIAKILVEKSATAATQNAPLYFLIAGDPFAGYEYILTELKASIEKLQLLDRVFYLGLVKNMEDFYTAIDLLVVPSQLPDPLPTVILEAMQFSIPVAATAQGGALEMVLKSNDSQMATGIFIPLQDAPTAALKISAILDKNILTQLGNAGAKRVATHFNKMVFEEKILKAIES